VLIVSTRDLVKFAIRLKAVLDPQMQHATLNAESHQWLHEQLDQILAHDQFMYRQGLDDY